MENLNCTKLKDKIIQIYVISCCYNDRLEDMRIAFSKNDAIKEWETFTGRDYLEYLQQQKEDSYDNSNTAGSKINMFEIKLSDLIFSQ